MSQDEMEAHLNHTYRHQHLDWSYHNMNSFRNSESKLYFVKKLTEISSINNISRWLFKSLELTFEISIPDFIMSNVNSSGQWIICKCDGVKIHSPLNNIKSIAGIDNPGTQKLIQFHIKQMYSEQLNIICRLWEFYDQINDPTLKKFFYHILSNRVFITLMFSLRDEHQYSYIGGLLEHSMRIADNAKKIAEQLNINTTVSELSFIAGFLYNINKFKITFITPTIDDSSVDDNFIQSLAIREQLINLKKDNIKFYKILMRCIQVRNRISNTPYLVELILSIALKITDKKPEIQKIPT